MSEQFANNCNTTVAAGGYTAASGVLNVASTAAPFPQVGDFRIAIYDVSTGVLKVILKVTAINSSTQFAVTAEGTDAAANATDIVRGTILSAAVLSAITPIEGDEAYSAGNFTGSSSMTWTVEEADVLAYHYFILGSLMYIWFDFNNTTVGGTVDYTLFFKIPNGNTSNTKMIVPVYSSLNGAKEFVFGYSEISSTLIGLQRMGGAKYAASTNQTRFSGFIVIAIQ